MIEFDLKDAVDILVVAGFAWLGIRYLRSTRARPAVLGLLLLFIVYGVARWIELELTANLLQAFSAVLVLVLVVVFQEDLRRVFEQLGAFVGTRRRESAPASGSLSILARAVAKLSLARTGALIVLPGREPLERHLEGGIALEGRLSEPLLLSLFDSSSPGHDGAVVLREGRIERFAVHLPLSTDHQQLGPGGTRHAAALGLAERCDAICVAVSEERGTISIAKGGELRVLERADQLAPALRAVERRSAANQETWLEPAVWLEALAALALAFGLWTVWVPGQTLAELSTEARIEVRNLPDDFALEAVEPATVEVTLAGRRRDLLTASTDDLRVSIDAYLARLGRRTFELDPSHVDVPSSLEVVSVEPKRVKISLARRSGQNPGDAGAAMDPGTAESE